MVREVGKRLCRCGLVFLFTCGYGPCLLLLACCMTVECFSFVAFLACLVSEEQCSYRCSSWRTDGSTIVVLFIHTYSFLLIFFCIFFFNFSRLTSSCLAPGFCFFLRNPFFCLLFFQCFLVG